MPKALFKKQPSNFQTLRLVVGQLQSNCYIVYIKGSSMAVIIDPGDDAEYIISKLLEFDLKPLAIILTHGHFDHLQAALTLQLAFGISCYLHKSDHFFLETSREVAIQFTKVDPGPSPQVTKIVGDSLKILDFEFSLLQVPGHTPGSIALYLKESKLVFVGDLVFADGSTGEWRHSYGNRKTLFRSIKKLLALPTATIVYPGHGEETTIKDLRELF